MRLAPNQRIMLLPRMWYEGFGVAPSWELSWTHAIYLVLKLLRLGPGTTTDDARPYDIFRSGLSRVVSTEGQLRGTTHRQIGVGTTFVRYGWHAHANVPAEGRFRATKHNKFRYTPILCGAGGMPMAKTG